MPELLRKVGRRVSNSKVYAADKVESLADNFRNLANAKKIIVPPRVCRQFARLALIEGTGRYTVTVGLTKYVAVFMTDRFQSIEVQT